MPMIVLKDVTKVFGNQTAVDRVSLEIKQGEFVFLLGKSGAGKSTLLKLIAKELEPSSGDIQIDGKSLTAMKKKEIPFLRRRFGVIWQDSFLLPDRTVYDNVSLAMYAIEQPQRLIDESVPAALSLVNMRKRADRFPHELSGGEQFKVALARAVVNNPQILCADEPTANLDKDSAWDIMCLLEEINRCGITVIVATHAQELVSIMRKRVVTLTEGRLLGDVKKGRYGDII